MRRSGPGAAPGESARRPDPGANLRIRLGRTDDDPFVRQVAGSVFAHLGDCASLLSAWLHSETVHTHLAEEDARPVGYTMLSFVPIELGPGPGGAAARPTLADRPAPQLAADLLALAVAPAAQGRGVGRRLLLHALQRVEQERQRCWVRELRLSVAEDNVRARRLFARFDFRVTEGEHGTYDGGQRALHLVRRLPL